MSEIKTTAALTFIIEAEDSTAEQIKLTIAMLLCLLDCREAEDLCKAVDVAKEEAKDKIAAAATQERVGKTIEKARAKVAPSTEVEHE